MTRPPLQLHLSTLLIVMLLASGLVWLNVREQVVFESKGVWLGRGWPWMYENWFAEAPIWHVGPDGSAFAQDVAVCLVLLTLGTAATEWLARRMKGKPTP
jgi:hypothetical protein